MIHIVMGTKAQLIKMAGIIHILDQKNISYNYIDTGQHAKITKRLRKQFGIKEPDFCFTQNEKNIETKFQAIIWLIKLMWKYLLNRKKIFKNDKKGFCLVHGDTISTLFGAIIGKFSFQRNVHVEAGFRSNNILRPFPEELIRRLVDRYSSINIAFSDDTEKILKKSKFKAKIFNVHENTLIDAVNIAKNSKSDIQLPENFILVTIHRFETIHSKKNLKFIVDTVLDLSKETQIVWGLHPPTKIALKNYKLYDKLKNSKNINIFGLFDYFDFINAISKSRFIINDGGGPQDETRYLNIPCLLMRSVNERPEHTNVYQSDFEKKKVQSFLDNLHKFSSKSFDYESPSEKIVQILLDN